MIKYFMDICPYLPAIWVDCVKIRQLYSLNTSYVVHHLLVFLEEGRSVG
jgi:hypothetical protein